MSLEHSQESEIDNTQNETADAQEGAAEANEASSPDATEGVSSSDTAVDEGQEDSAEAIRNAFLEKFGAEDGDEGEDTSESADEAEPKVEAKTERDQASESDQAADDGGDDDEFRITDEEFRSLPEGARKRIGQLNARAKKAERQLGELNAQLEPAQQSHERMQQLEGFMQENNIQADGLTKAFSMMAKLSSGDYEGFLSDVSPFVDLARQASGQAYSEDLQEQVDDGYLTEEAAREITQQRVLNSRLRQQNEALVEGNTARQAADQAAEAQNHIASAVTAREQEISSSDPDYAHLADAVKRNVEFALQSGAAPRTAEDGVALLNRAYEMAKASAPRKPAPTPTPPRPSASTTARGHTTPQTTRDAIADAMEGYVPSA